MLQRPSVRATTSGYSLLYESRRVDIESPTNLFAALFNPLPHLDDGVFGLADGRQGVIIRRPFAHRKLVEDPEKQY